MKCTKKFSLVALICFIIFPEFADTLSKHPKLVVISFDGFRSDYLNKAPTPALNSLIADGVSVPYMKAQFTTKTFVNHQSIATGLYAESHGVIDNVLFDPLHNRLLSGFESYNDQFWNFHEEAVPIWIRNEWAGDSRFSGVQFPGCQQHYGRNRTLPTHFLQYDVNRPFNTRMDYVVQWLTNATHPANLVFMYFNEPDSAGHTYGPDTPQVNAQITRADTVTGYLMDKLKAEGIYDQVNIIVLGDHGMQKVNVGNQYDLEQLVGLDSSYYTKYGGSPVFQVLPAPGREAQVFKAFKNASVGRNFDAYTREEVPERWHYKNNRRILPMVVVARSGYVFEDANLNWRAGWHGYDNDEETMKTIFIARGPAFKKGFKASSFSNVDLFSLFSFLMRFEAAPNNGTFSNVKPILVAPQMNEESLLIV